MTTGDAHIDDTDRPVIERMGHAFHAGIESTLQSRVDMGLPSGWNDDDMNSRPAPIRATVVHFGAPLRDVAVLVSSMSADVVGAVVESSVASMLRDFGLAAEGASDVDAMASADVRIDEPVDYDNRELAHEQTEALVGEMTIRYACPVGNIAVIMGSGLVVSARCFTDGVPDTGEFNFVALTGAAVSPAGAPAVPLSIDEFDAQLEADAASDQGDADIDTNAAAHAALLAAAADANAAAAHAPSHGTDPGPANAQRWASLLSGVEVELTAELGRTELPLGNIASLVANSVLTLDQLVTEPVRVYVNGTQYATARLVIVEGEYGIEILEVLDQGVVRESIGLAA